MAVEIDVLRSFRDRKLERNRLGKRLVKLYYQISPPIADAISLSELRRKIVRTFLDPIVKIFKKIGY